MKTLEAGKRIALHNILFATDFSPHSNAALPYALAPPAERILEIANDRAADLIVLGVRPTHGAGSTVTHLSHTTAQHIVAHAACPVLTVAVEQHRGTLQRWKLKESQTFADSLSLR